MSLHPADRASPWLRWRAPGGARPPIDGAQPLITILSTEGDRRWSPDGRVRPGTAGRLRRPPPDAAGAGRGRGRTPAGFVLYDRSLPPGGEAARTAAVYWAAIDALAADGTTELLRAAGSTDPMDADALRHVWTDLVSTLVRWWVKHPEEAPEAMTRRCARLFTVAAALAVDPAPPG
ncbi:hypothetical protein ACH4M4_19390 [Streptomyces sp. NPDC017254]|uniref:hypothetical protein n=1 Tax=unclassified Streptomyces TaxID=2593676 RepID=UPI0037939107